MPNIGFWAAAGAGGAAGAYELISSTILTGTSTSITFSSIPSTYKHLQVRMVAGGVGVANINKFNSDTGSNYTFHRLLGDAGAVQSGAVPGQTFFWTPALSTTSNIFGAVIIDILDYASSSKNTTVRMFGGVPEGTGQVALNSGVWLNTAALTQFSIEGSTFSVGSRFSLYGVKG